MMATSTAAAALLLHRICSCLCHCALVAVCCCWFLFVASSSSSSSRCSTETVAVITVDGKAPVSRVDDDYICATLDSWPHDKYDYGTRSWGNASLLNLYVRSKVDAWRYNPIDKDQRLPHKFHPNQPVLVQHIHELGVLVWKLDPDNWEDNAILEKVKKDRGYNYWDIVTLAPGMIDDYEGKVRYFFTEHLHAHEEIRFILDGRGYWDIRDYDETWIRFRIEKGDMIVLPAGMYHRFTLDTHNYVKAIRLFKGVPSWTQHLRPADDMEARKVYIEQVLKKQFSFHNPFVHCNR